MHPNRVQVVRNNGAVVEEQVLENTHAYLAAYVVIFIVSVLLISIDGFSTTTNISAVLACFNNIGPGMAAVGATCNFAGYGILSKLILTVDMLAGRLEIFPILVLLSRSTWKKH
jgi:trk system potassium uptake protein TrkH